MTLREWVGAVTLRELPEGDFLLYPHVTVTDPAMFLAALQEDVRQGRKSPRWKTGALQADMEQLHLIVKGYLPW